MAVKNLSTTGVLYTDRRIFYPDPMVVKELWPEVTPFLTVMSQKGLNQVNDPDYKMFEHRPSWLKMECSLNDATPPTWTNNGDPSTGVLASCTLDGFVNVPDITSAFDDWYLGQVVEIWNAAKTTYKGNALVTAGATGEITLKALGNPTATTYRMAAAADDDVFVFIGTAHGEGAYAPKAAADELEVVYNSTQIMRTAIEITGTLYATSLRGYSNELERLRMEKLKEHKIMKERTFLLGVRAGGTGSRDLGGDNVTNADSFTLHPTDASSRVVRTTMGLIPAIYRYGASSGDSQNIFAITGSSYTYAAFTAHMDKVFNNVPSSGRKIALCGGTALSYFSTPQSGTSTLGMISNSGLTVNVSDNKQSVLGYNFRELLTPHGVLELVHAPVLRGPYANHMLIIDPDHVELKQFRPFALKTNIKTDDGYDGVKDEYFSDEGVAIRLIDTSALFKIS